MTKTKSNPDGVKPGYDFVGMATRYNIPCKDGRTILPKAFAHQHMQQVPLVWQHDHKTPTNVLGHAILVSIPEGVRAYGYLNETDTGKHAKVLVHSADINALSIWANELEERNKLVAHGDIKELSLVLAGANRGALIENVIRHDSESGEDYYSPDEAVIQFNEPFVVHEAMMNTEDPDAETSDGETVGDILKTFNKDQEAALHYAMAISEFGELTVPEDAPDVTDGPTVKEVYDTLNEKQKDVFNYLVASVSSDQAEHSSLKEAEETMNVFDKNDYREDTNDALKGLNDILHNAVGQNSGTLRNAFLAHAGTYGIDDVDVLFPDGYTDPAGKLPQVLENDLAWTDIWMAKTSKQPFARIKSIYADITADIVRARGYVTGNEKVEAVVAVLKRKTEATTVYVKQKLDRDDIIDTTEFDIVVWIKQIMRNSLKQEVAVASLLGDGRLVSDDDKIDETKIRPVWTDDPVFAPKVLFEAGTPVRTLIDEITKARSLYRGSGSPTLWCATDFLNEMFLDRDADGHRMFKSIEELAAILRVSSIVDVPTMTGKLRTDNAIERELLAIMVNPRDYSFGTDRQGQTAFFDDFDIDFNQQKYLYEGRTSGALTVVKSAIVFEIKTA